MNAIPGYAKYFYIIANLVLTAFVLIMGNFIFAPLLAAMIIAILLDPIHTKLVKWGIPRLLSASLTVLIFLILIFILISFITIQISYISTDPSLSALPLIQLFNSSQRWAAHFFGYSLFEQGQLIEEAFNNFLKSTLVYIPNLFQGTTTYLAMFVLFILSLFFFLYYKKFFLTFALKVSGRENKEQLDETIDKINDSIKNYIVGLFVVISIIASLNSIGLLMLGIPHAFFFGLLSALLTIIPYVGILVGALLPATYAFVITGELFYPTSVIILFSMVQFLEGNFITPNIVGSKADINPFVAVLGLFIGDMLFGLVGIIFAIPLLGIAKIIFDDIDALKPIGFIMGNPHKEPRHFFQWINSLFKKKSK